MLCCGHKQSWLLNDGKYSCLFETLTFAGLLVWWRYDPLLILCYFATGTDGNADTNPTLANLLKRCNPGLIGRSRGQDSAIFDTGQNLKEYLRFLHYLTQVVVEVSMSQ